MSFLFDYDIEKERETIRQIAATSIVLRDYQLAAVEAVYKQWRRHRSTLVVLPTGGGKSVVFSEVMRRWPVEAAGRVLLIAHRKELIAQAVGHANRAGLTVGMEMASHRAKGTEDVIVASVQTLVASTKCTDCLGEGCDCCDGKGKVKRMTRFRPRDFGLVTIDEAHHALAKSYRSVLTWFHQNPNSKDLFVTATPKRADNLGLKNVCETVAYNMSLRDAIDGGWLVPIKQMFITVDGVDLSKVETSKGDLAAGQVERQFIGTDENEERQLHAIVKPTIEIADGKPAIVFASGKEHAQKLTAAFNAHGIKCACITEETLPDDRDQYISEYKRGDLQMLINCMVLTEGFDAPATYLIANCRPTKSESLYLQIIGRGTRTLPGVVDGPETPELRKAAIARSDKPYCIILDFVGNAGQHKLVSIHDCLAGDKVEPVLLAEALEIAKVEPSTLTTEELLEKAKQAREERKKKEDERRREMLMTNTFARHAEYTVVDVDLFSGSGFEYDSAQNPLVSSNHAWWLKHNAGISYKEARKMTVKAAKALVKNMREHMKADWSEIIRSTDSVEKLQRVGDTLAAKKTKDKILNDEPTLSVIRSEWKQRKRELESTQTVGEK